MWQSNYILQPSKTEKQNTPIRDLRETRDMKGERNAFSPLPSIIASPRQGRREGLPGGDTAQIHKRAADPKFQNDGLNYRQDSPKSF